MMWILQKHLESFMRILRASKDCSAQGTSVNIHLAIAALLRHLVQRVKTCHWVFQMRIFDENLLPVIIVLWNILDRNARTTFFKVFYSLQATSYQYSNGRFLYFGTTEEMGKYQNMTLFVCINHFVCPTVDFMLYSVSSCMLCNQVQRNPRSLLASHHRKSVLITTN